MDNVLTLINNLNIDKNESVVIACSGGPDSMYLMYLLNSLGYKCVCAHVNHKLRKESDSEYLFVKKYCEDNNIIFEGIELTGYETGNFENYAREFRYNFFENVLDKYDSKHLFTAHHGDDLIETVLMRIVRGSSLKGYAGFSSITDKKHYKVVRPLIYLTKDEILKLNEENNIPSVIDNTNLEDHYTRNRYRHHVLPFLKEEEPSVHLRFLSFSEEIKETLNYIDSIVDKCLSDMYVNNSLDINKFNLEDDYIKFNIINKILTILYPDNLYLVNKNHIEEVLKIINSDKPNVNIVLPNNINVVKEYDKLSFNVNITNNTYRYELVDEVVLETGIIKKVDNSDSNSNYIIRLNSKDIKLPIIVRSRENGDRISIKNLNGTKKIKDIFINEKISSQERDIWPIVADSSDNILWVPGLKKSNFDIPINEEYDIILKYEKKERNYEEKI